MSTSNLRKVRAADSHTLQSSHHDESQEPISGTGGLHVDQPLPRPERGRNRAKSDRGLPSDLELARLATEYLQRQRKLWPEFVKAGLLPEINDETIARMVENFKSRHRGGKVELQTVAAFMKICKRLGGNYGRYSCDNSNPTSILDQLARVLEKARAEERFVPWSYVYADYSVSGLDSSRQGYTSYKALLNHDQHMIETTYVDDFTRASRDELEWWKLAHMSKRLGKRMIGASDGFDLSLQNWDVNVTVYGLLSRLFIKGLREKVRRGMSGAARRRTCLGRQSLGFTRCVCRDEHGNPIRDQHDAPMYQPCIDPNTAPYRLMAYELFVQKCWSPYKIAKHFNQLRVDGSDGWTATSIKNMMRNANAIGVFVWNRKRQEFDYDLQKWVTVQNPRSQWVVYYDEKLAIVPKEVWIAARKRLALARWRSKCTGRKPSRNEKSATTLFSGTLVCGYCGQDHGGEELKLIRSAGKYKSMGCFHGTLGTHGCKLTSSKSTKIIEECLLRFIQSSILNDKCAEALVRKANMCLAEEAARPNIDTKKLEDAISNKEAAVRKLVARIERCKDDGVVETYEKRIAALQKEVRELKTNLQAAKRKNEPPPAPLDLATVKALLAEGLRDVLNQEIPAAAAAIRSLTGPITIRQESIPGRKRGAKWIATFSPDFLGWLRHQAKERNYPESVTLEFLTDRIWIIPETVEIAIENAPAYEKICAEVAAYKAKGTSISTIATVLGTSAETVKQALCFFNTGKPPKLRSRRKKKTRGHTAREKLDSAEVVRLHDEDNLSLIEIAWKLCRSYGTVARAYDRARPEFAFAAAQQGKRLNRGSRPRLSPEIFNRIRSALAAGQRPGRIAGEVGCGVSTVYRVRRKMRS